MRRISELQSAGHSLDAIRRILNGGESGVVPATTAAAMSAAAPPLRRAPRPALSAELWTRLRLGEGVELHYDAARYRPTVEQLMQLREAVRAALAPSTDSDPDDDAA